MRQDPLELERVVGQLVLRMTDGLVAAMARALLKKEDAVVLLQEVKSDYLRSKRRGSPGRIRPKTMNQIRRYLQELDHG